MFRLIKFLIKIIVLAILALILILIFNPWSLRTKLITSAINYYFSNGTITEQTTTSSLDIVTEITTEDSLIENTDKNPLLSAEQEKTLEDWGVDVAQLPTEISPEMQACFIEKLGEERVAGIMKGGTPSALDLLKAKGCL